MTDGFEQRLQSAVQRWHYRIMLRLHPELNRLTEDKDRGWAIWFARHARPRWQRLLGLWSMAVIGPLAATLFTVAVGGALGLITRSNFILPVIGAAIIGFVLAAWLDQLAMRRSIIRVCYRAMRISGHDLCPGCGYDLTGHPPRGLDPRTCPECGRSVPPLDAALDTAA